MKAALKAISDLNKDEFFTTGATRDSTNVKQTINCTSAEYNVASYPPPSQNYPVQ